MPHIVQIDTTHFIKRKLLYFSSFAPLKIKGLHHYVPQNQLIEPVFSSGEVRANPAALCLATERSRASFLHHPLQRQLANVQSGVQIPCQEYGLFAFGAFAFGTNQASEHLLLLSAAFDAHML